LAKIRFGPTLLDAFGMSQGANSGHSGCPAYCEQSDASILYN